MVEVLFFMVCCAFSALLGWSLGVRRERGIQQRRDRIRTSASRRGGLRLHRITVKR